MPAIKEITVYKFEELSESAKERARDWYRRGICDDSWWYECVYEDAATIADLMGIDLRQRAAKTIGGATVHKPAIYFSGFASQGDGACFEGEYRYRTGALKAVKDYAPELHRIAADLQAIQKRHFYKLRAKSKQRGRYSHSGSMAVDVWHVDGVDVSRDAEDSITQALRDFADWIYRQLEKEYDFQNSDEAIDESIIANGYEFLESGKLA